MNPETLDRIFDPFFSTRFTGRGLGLPVVLGIVKAHGGAVFVESSPGAGTAVHVLLPLADELPSATAPSPVGVPATPVAGKGLVLVVDDEPAIRSLAQGMLRRLGFEAILAPNGANAVEIFQQRPREIRCILCDLTMPGMNGWETLSALRQIRADIPVILCSGYDEAAVMADTWADRPQSFLGKPYGMKTLSDSLAKALG
jgi:CheY-like chemotaxis protein